MHLGSFLGSWCRTCQVSDKALAVFDEKRLLASGNVVQSLAQGAQVRNGCQVDLRRRQRLTVGRKGFWSQQAQAAHMQIAFVVLYRNGWRQPA